MEPRAYRFTTRGRLPALGIGLLALVLLGALLAIGVTVLVAVAAVGTLVAVVALGVRTLRLRLGRALGRSPEHDELDPSAEVFPPRKELEGK